MGFFSKPSTSSSFGRPRAVLNTDVRTLFVPGRQINEEFLNEMEEKLLHADMGVKNVERIVADDARPLAAGQDQERATSARTSSARKCSRGWAPADEPRAEIRPDRADGHPRRRHQRRGQDHQHRQARLAA